jgi:hypothetical protein
VGTGLALNLRVDLGLVVVAEPVGLLLHLLLEKDVVLAVLVDVLEQVDAGLVFAPPLLLPVVPLLFVLLLSEFVNVALEGGLVALDCVVVLLELLDLSAARKSLLSFQLLHSLLVTQSLVKKHLVTCTLLHLGVLAELLLGGVVADELEVPLTVEQELLVGIILLLFLLDSPLLLEHSLLAGDKLVLLRALHLTRVLLPVEDGHSVADLLLLLSGLDHFALEFLLGVELPELRIDLLLEHLRLDGPSLVNQLLLALDGRSIVVKLGIFLAESVVGGLELHVLAAGHLVHALLLALPFQILQPLKHLLPNLLRRLQVVVKFLFVDSVFSGEELGEAGFPLLEVDSLSAAHVLDAVLDDAFVDERAGLGLPVGLVGQAARYLEVIQASLLSLQAKKRVQAQPG